MGSNRRFMIGLVGVAAVVSYLIWTGVSDTMTYFLTPTEFNERVAEDPTFRDVGVKIGANVVPDTYRSGDGELEHRFVLVDKDNPEVTMEVLYTGVLPDTFSDAPDMLTEAVVEGRMNEEGVFEATLLLTKCGSRYEAAPEDFQDDGMMPVAPGAATE